MIDVDALLKRISEYNPRSDKELIRKAYAYGERMHDGQFRRSGEPYFTHPFAVAMILAEQRLDDASIITALLHDTIEDTRSTKSMISDEFSSEIAELVDGVTKLTNMELSSNETKEAENIRKLIMAMARDVRVVLVKLADRLHNMRTIKSMPQHKQLQKARETMEIFAPLAGRFGMQSIREDLEDLSFKVLNPEGRASIIRRFVKLRDETGNVKDRITNDIQLELAAEGIAADIYGREKRPYSIWRKMQEKELSFSRLSDIYGFRVITENEADCYRILGAIHRRWRSVPGRFKDYISQPKSNGYRSLHTTVSGRDGKRVEVQIRTHQMHDVAESGVAAHWAYREGERVENPFAVDPFDWINSLIDQITTEDDHQDFLESFKLEMYADKVFCFTPKGEVIKLPRGATPIDFAFAIHTRIGTKCVGAKVDGLRVPLWTRLRNGQSVEIITAQGQVPQEKWLTMAATGKAKSAIKRSVKEVNRQKHVVMGQELARAAFEGFGKKATDKVLQTAAKKLLLPSKDELLARLGTGSLSTSDVLQIMYPDVSQKQNSADFGNRAVIGLKPGQSFTRASCCQPLPGQRIVGIVTENRGVVVHTIDCDSLIDYEDEIEPWLDLNWHEGRHAAVYPVSFDVTISNDAGVLGKVCTLIGEAQGNISDLEFINRNSDFYRLHIDIELRNIEQFHVVTTALEAEGQVASVQRLRQGDGAVHEGDSSLVNS